MTYFTIATRLIDQARTQAGVDRLRVQIDNSTHLTEEQKVSSHFRLDGRENIIQFGFV